MAYQKSTIKVHFIPYFGKYQVNQINRMLVDGFFTEQGKIEIKRKEITQKTIKNRYSILQAIFNEAIEQGHIDKNPVTRKKGQKPYKVKEEKLQVLTDDEFQRIYDNAQKHLKPQLICYWNTGMRKMEVLNLQIKDVDLKGKKITVQAEKSKNGKFRNISINDELLPVLKDQMKGKDLNDYVFTYGGKKVQNNRGAFQSAIKEAETGRKVKLHHLRHRFGTYLMRNGTPDKVAMKISGHSDP